MDFQALISLRQSVRAYRPEPIEEAILAVIREAIVRAPSAGNLQALQVFEVSDPTLRARLAGAALGQDFLASAPIAFVFCADPARSAVKYGDRGARLYSVQDATIACTFAMLAATEAGLGCVWIGAFDEHEVSRVLNLPPHLVPVAILPVGRAAETPKRRGRRPVCEVIRKI